MTHLATSFRLPLFAVCFAGLVALAAPSTASAQTLGTRAVTVGSAAGSSTVILSDAGLRMDRRLEQSLPAPQPS